MTTDERVSALEQQSMQHLTNIQMLSTVLQGIVSLMTAGTGDSVTMAQYSGLLAKVAPPLSSLAYKCTCGQSPHTPDCALAQLGATQ